MTNRKQEAGNLCTSTNRRQHVLSPTRAREEWPRTAPDVEATRRICVLDTETTGLNINRHQIIELCAAIVLVDDAARIVAVQSVLTGLIDPGHPLAADIVKLTGLTDADLAGHSICRQQLTELFEYCDGVIAFNAAFDRPFIEKYLGAHTPVPWGCAMADISWRDLGYEPGPQGYVIMQSGYFMPTAHRAKDDVLALIQLLDHECRDGETVVSKALAAMDADAWRFEASNAPYAFREDLRDQRYRYAGEPRHKLWHKHVRPTDFQAEYRWYQDTIGKPPVVVPLPATERYRATDTWLPTRTQVTTPSWLK